MGRGMCVVCVFFVVYYEGGGGKCVFLGKCKDFERGGMFNVICFPKVGPTDFFLR